MRSFCDKSTLAITTSSFVVLASARTLPNESQTNDASPELQPTLFANTVHCSYVDAVCYGVGTLDGSPCVMPVAVCGGVAFYVADGGWVKDDFCPIQSVDACWFREPLVIADKYTNTRISGVVSFVSLFAWCKVVFFVEVGVIWDVGFTVDACD